MHKSSRRKCSNPIIFFGYGVFPYFAFLFCSPQRMHTNWHKICTKCMVRLRIDNEKCPPRDIYTDKIYVIDMVYTLYSQLWSVSVQWRLIVCVCVYVCRIKNRKLNDLQMQLVELIEQRWSVNISEQAFKSKSTFESR